MIVVTGCPRSGTSLTMLLLRVALGDERIIGSKWMNIDRKEENKSIEACNNYVLKKIRPGWREQVEQTKDMNRDGFWECPWTVRGIQYAPESPAANSVCKIVCRGLSRSNPQYIDKLVYVIRHPWQVANSQKNLSLPMPIKGGVRNKDIGNISTKMFIADSVMAAKWIQKHQPDLLMVNYDDYFDRPGETLQGLRRFVGDGDGDGDWRGAADNIDPDQKRSRPERAGDAESWDLSIDVYNAMQNQDWQRVIDLYEANKPERQARFRCTRWGGVVVSAICKTCQTTPVAQKNMIKTASRRRVEWWNEPCLWECGRNPDESFTPITIEQSIQNNHWLKVKSPPIEGAGDLIERLANFMGIESCARCRRWKRFFNKYLSFRRRSGR